MLWRAHHLLDRRFFAIMATHSEAGGDEGGDDACHMMGAMTRAANGAGRGVSRASNSGDRRPCVISPASLGRHRSPATQPQSRMRRCACRVSPRRPIVRLTPLGSDQRRI